MSTGGNTNADANVSTIQVDDSQAVTCYANFCRVANLPEEVVLDLAMNANPPTGGRQTLRITQRVVMNHFTAKRLLAALSDAVHRHEQAFGTLETDIRKRLQGGQG